MSSRGRSHEGRRTFAFRAPVAPRGLALRWAAAASLAASTPSCAQDPMRPEGPELVHGHGGGAVQLTEGTDSTASSAGSTTSESPVCTKTRPVGFYADCLNGSLASCQSPSAGCLVNRRNDPSFGVCYRACESACECWAAPEGTTAVPACLPVLVETGRACVLDCTTGGTCPAGMRCASVTATAHVCIYERASDGTTG